LLVLRLGVIAIKRRYVFKKKRFYTSLNNSGPPEILNEDATTRGR